ncbi:PDZ domain-containing protein [Acinetobacter albensis]|uniref:PDZ domain-containing protein n=1 Tax=Acinetobacter albensis TaxID=1673609 RepID=A0A1C4GY14_9GAMM|nr:PDZ domain-containing protein [Acinetobacter albensis]SCC72855.1 PDZ domain-containing protein [Acinetobacter albensis]
MMKLLGFCSVLMLVCSSNIVRAEGYSGKNVQSLNPQIFKVDDLEEKTLEMLQEGYVPIFKEKFIDYSYSRSMRDIREKALLHGSPIAVFSNEYQGNKLIYDTRMREPEAARISGNDRNKNDVNNLNNIPVGTIESRSVRYESLHDQFRVIYFYKFNSITGIYPADLSERDKIYNGIQSGVVAKVLKRDSPAENVIMPQDIILKMNDENIKDVSAFVESSNYLKGNTVKFEILRKGQKIPLQISMK